jgi:hypothetical protein
MKKFMILALTLVTSIANAASVVVMEADLPLTTGMTLSNTRFYMDTKTGEGFVKALVSETRYTWTGNGWCTLDPYNRCFPHHNQPMPTQVLVFSGLKKIDGLMLMGDQAVYHSAQGNIVCGTMGESRVLKVPTLYLSGNCSLSSKITGNKLTVTLTTK